MGLCKYERRIESKSTGAPFAPPSPSSSPSSETIRFEDFVVIIGLLVILALIFAGVAWRNVHVATIICTANQAPRRTEMLIRFSSRASQSISCSWVPIRGQHWAVTIKADGYDHDDDAQSAKKATTIVSLPRDMKVNLPGYAEYSPAKINAAYTYGGVKETINTVQKYFNVPIDYYVMVNMGGLEKAINQVGGVSVTSPLTFDYEGYSFKKGKTYHMNGAKPWPSVECATMIHRATMADKNASAWSLPL
jgi:cell envelope-related function transcriptional attenuator common domain